MLLILLGLPDDLDIVTDFPCVGLGLNFLIKEFGDVDLIVKGELDLSVGLMLTETGFVRGSCFGGNLSGGPMESSRRFFFFFSLLRSELSDRTDLLEVLDFFSLLCLSSTDLFWEGIGIIVIELDKDVCGLEVIGIISIPGLLSRPIPVKAEEKLGDELELELCGTDDVMGVMLTDDGIKPDPSSSINKEAVFILVLR